LSACYDCGYAALKNLVDEISRSYAACAADEELDDEPLQYADLAEWQMNYLQEKIQK